jgi:glutaredoxin 3
MFMVSFLHVEMSDALFVSNNKFTSRATTSISTQYKTKQCVRITTRVNGMKRPILDQLASTLFKLENDRVEKSSVVDDKGRKGEPMEWSESESLANKFSQVVAGNSLGYQFKQFVADIVAGNDFDKDAVSQEIDDFVSKYPVAMFSFTTCPFCRRAKDVLDEKGVRYVSMELDELEGNKGNEIRAMLGRKTGRTSVPCIFINANCIGGCNDGPGLLPLAQSGELDKLLESI